MSLPMRQLRTAADVNLAEALATMNFDVDLDDDEMISDAVVVARVTRLSDGRTSVTFTRSEGADEVTVAGLLECARQINEGDWRSVGEV